jgi:hypothetical protein
MEDFQPRIEQPPEVVLTNSEKVKSKNEKLREFVRTAAGQWCLIYESSTTTKFTRNSIRARLWSVFKVVNGYRVSGFELRAIYIQKVYKIYAKYDAASAVKNAQ